MNAGLHDPFAAAPNAASDRALAEALYAPDPGDTDRFSNPCAARFLEHLLGSAISAGTAPDMRAAEAAALVLRDARTGPAPPFADELLATALRPARRIASRELACAVCDTLFDIHRGVWADSITRPQQTAIDSALALTLSTQQPELMHCFWKGLHSPNPLMRDAMYRGLDYLTAAHAVPALLFGLEHETDHTIRASIVERLEAMAEASALDSLMRLQQETAHSDWTLSRQIGRTIHTIKQQNRGEDQQVLLRPTVRPKDRVDNLLRLPRL